jgi:type I restriction enzyme M protein
VSEYYELTGLIWSISDVLRGSFKASEYGSVILPLIVLRRLAGLQEEDARDGAVPESRRTSEPYVRATTVFSPIHDTSDPAVPVGGPDLIDLVLDFIHGLPADSARALELFDLDSTILRLERAGLLRHVVDSFAALDLRPAAVMARQMGQVFERLVRLVAETGAETAGEHYSPPDITGLMASLLLTSDRETPSRAAPEVRVYDPTCGTGGLFSAFES